MASWELSLHQNERALGCQKCMGTPGDRGNVLPAWLRIVLLAVVLALPLGAGAQNFQHERQGMIQTIEADAQAIARTIGEGELDEKVLEVMGRVPRHAFVPPSQRRYAYQNRPLPIGYGQTISQPYIVALMTDLLKLKLDHRVLEVGTGSGYQAAILAELTESVYSIEIIEELGKQAEQRLRDLGYHNATVRVGDGYYGWEEHAPFDTIIVTAATSHIPPPLIRQLKPGGRMVIPVGTRFLVQELLLVEKNADGSTRTRQILPVRFVPLTGGH
jgi:protein-L-isoaspartate(D-aspartate) O-methyltransferase